MFKSIQPIWACIHSPTGAFLGDITMDRLRILELAPIGILQIRPLTMSLQAIKRQSSKTQAGLYTLTVVLLRMHRDRI